ncbi:helix-turn-helix transcriptional regulator [Krasilnikovia sp. MM14-A1259]|uniref:helix-turn-helix transcriptional regulator n=1 Tax=Krasilnikovia sp. MM14-A1259 TaxID=3373539 RepID=UPI00382767BF
MTDRFVADVDAVAALGEPVRRDLYRYVVAQGEPVGREQAAAGVGVAHHVAKFNLDRLVADGLLDVEYRRPPGRSGPGAGRPAKLYRRATRDIAVTLPERHYDLAGEVLAEAFTIAGRDGLPIDEAVHAAARATGRRLGGSRPGDAQAAVPETASAAEIVTTVLGSYGYEPRATDAGIMLANCPFHRLAQLHTELVCGMNLHLIDGLLDEVGATGLCARLNPGPDRCCVSITPAGQSAP